MAVSAAPTWICIAVIPPIERRKPTEWAKPKTSDSSSKREKTKDARFPGLARRSPLRAITVFHGASSRIAMPAEPCTININRTGSVPVPYATVPLAKAIASKPMSATFVRRPAIVLL
jgi:hypothetical protein